MRCVLEKYRSTGITLPFKILMLVFVFVPFVLPGSYPWEFNKRMKSQVHPCVAIITNIHTLPNDVAEGADTRVPLLYETVSNCPVTWVL